KFTVDFFCVEERLVIELDGQSHANIGTRQADEQRDQWLQQEGYQVLRFSNDEVYRQTERVVWEIEDSFGWYL
ncbi:MAG: endonuclease domain-containing protein, partial [Pontibacter sp.]|nr:endonuclease domain-containing protein [Pontibacter sp.]